MGQTEGLSRGGTRMALGIQRVGISFPFRFLESVFTLQCKVNTGEKTGAAPRRRLRQIGQRHREFADTIFDRVQRGVERGGSGRETDAFAPGEPFWL